MSIAVPEIGLGSACLRPATLPELIDAAEATGFHRITVSPFAFAQALNSGWTEAALRSRLANAAIIVTMIDGLALSLPGTRLPRELEPSMLARLPPDLLEPPDEATCFRAAQALGASILNVGHYMGPALPRDDLAGALTGICQRAAPLGIKICLEFFPDSGCPDLSFAQSVVRACGQINASIMLDVFHLDRSGGSIEDIRQLPPGAIAGIQISDRTPPPPGTSHIPFSGRQLPGKGKLRLREIVEAALANSPNATVDIEVLNDQLRNLPPNDAAALLADAATAWRISLA
jgi:sugar phosphate isomerase/epimerase